MLSEIIDEIIGELCKWLLRNQCSFMLAQVQETEGNRAQVSIIQVEPERRQRVFNVTPSEVADCWNVVEVES